MIGAVVAAYADWGIGFGGTQPVALRADRRRFRELTDGAAVIVGRKTLADFPGGKPLKNRRNIILTRQDLAIPDARIAHSPAEALALAGGGALVIGGASVYRVMLPYIERVYVTRIDLAPVSDSFFPDLDADAAFVCADAGQPLFEDGICYRFCVYDRKNDPYTGKQVFNGGAHV